MYTTNSRSVAKSGAISLLKGITLISTLIASSFLFACAGPATLPIKDGHSNGHAAMESPVQDGHLSREGPNMEHMHHAKHKDHSAHRAMLKDKFEGTKYQSGQSDYKLDGLSLTRMDETNVDLSAELSSDAPVVLNFIFTTCSTVCPVLSATFSNFQEKLGADATSVKMISISIDPEQDTPAKLREYAKKFQAGPQWQFYTGSVSQSVDVQRAFDAYRGGKMNHIPLTFLRAAGKTEWVRLEGFTSATELLNEYQRLSRS